MELRGISVIGLGQTGENKRVWIVNKKVQEVFAIGEKLKVDYNSSKKTITINKADSTFEANHSVSSRNGKTPIIDIKNRKVEETFGTNVEKVEVLYFDNQIVIKVSKGDLSKNERANKTGRDTFELFCGGGTLSHFFKKAGFSVRGGLELNPDYLALFHENNPGEHILSINAKLEDVDTSYFPKDISLVLCGIPCDRYTGANLKQHKALKAKRDGKDFDVEEIKKRYSADALTFYVLQAIKAMNPKTVVVEEVVEYSESTASIMLRTILEQMGYDISESISTGSHTKRQRWVLVANMNGLVKLDDLITDDGKTIEDFLETSIEDREWQTELENPRVDGMIRKGLGIRAVMPSETMSNTFTTHSTRHTEPILKHPTKNLYSEFTNREIANIHGLDGYVLDERKTVSRQVVGQGVTDMFYTVAKRILDAEHSKAVCVEKPYFVMNNNSERGQMVINF